MTTLQNRRFFKFSLFVVVYIIGVIVWGAYVRASGSGAGCGRHWPLCNGEIIPRSVESATFIEFGHRVTSGFSLVLVGALVLGAYRGFSKRSPVRIGATLSGVFLLIEAAFGAVLVMLELVAHNDSVLRAIAVSLHLVNTFFLLGALSYTGWSAFYDRYPGWKLVWNLDSILTGTALLWFLFVGASGAIVALGDTLFPAKSFVAGFSEDFSPGAHFLIRLRVIHPALAVGLAAYLFYLADRYRAMSSLGLAVVIQTILGASTALLAAPIELQMLHLVSADIAWIILILVVLKVQNQTIQKKLATPNT